MNAFLFYLGRSGLYLSLFYAFYLLVMRRTTFFRLNRSLLLIGSYLCLLLPFVRLRTVSGGSAGASALTMVASEPAQENLPTPFPWADVLFGLFLAGALVTVVAYVLSARKMRRLIRKGKAQECEGFRLILLDEDVPSFSWGRQVVMSARDLQENPAILTHERMHVKSRHSLDLMLFLPLQVLFWWDPLLWITREELRLLHEYEADEGVIQKGIDATQYQLLLVRKAVGDLRFSLASGFQHAKLKNRITMMQKTNSRSWMRYSYLALIPALAVLMYACNPTKDKKAEAIPEPQEEVTKPQEEITKSAVTEEKDAVPFQLVETKPSFQGGDTDEFSKWVNSQLVYPESARNEGVSGRVTAMFTVDVDGVLKNVKILRGIRDDLDNEVLRVLNACPKWTPGKDETGTPVPVSFTFPVIFTLK